MPHRSKRSSRSNKTEGHAVKFDVVSKWLIISFYISVILMTFISCRITLVQILNAKFGKEIQRKSDKLLYNKV